MIFYEDFVKKIEELEGEDLSFSEIESFGLGKKKKIGGYGIALPLILIACYEIFVAFFLKQYYLILIALVLFYFGIRQCRNMWAYRITLDTKEKHLLFQKMDIDLENLSSLQVREAKIGRKVIPVLDFITKDKKQMILPMYMENQVFLVRILQKMLGVRFSIQK